jgi:N-acetylmuramoyl-L-alanine amidase
MGWVVALALAGAVAATGARAGEPRWPEPGAPLRVEAVEFPRRFGVRRVFIDAGHGAAGNVGVASVACELEQDFTLRVAEDLARRLEATGHFRVKVSRRAGEEVSYPRRLRAAERFGAEVILSLHADARGMATAWQPAPGTWCWRQDATPGFAVLYSDRGAPALRDGRRALGRALARHLAASGLLAYDGVDYEGQYLKDEAQAGAFVDRRFLYLLKRPEAPSVIVETHHFLDFEEAARWREERTLEAFAAAVAGGLVEALARPHNPGPFSSDRGTSHDGADAPDDDVRGDRAHRPHHAEPARAQ